jgi:nucleoside-diphosphate-sugar epimerase
MRVLVTGATGRIGSRLVPRLAAGGEVRVVVRDPDRAAELWNRGFDVIDGDLRDPETVKRAVAGQDAVVHLAAAFRGVPDGEMVAVNRDATVELARASLTAGVERFVLASTSLVYGPGRGRPAVEDDEPRPTGGYPTSKAAAEHALAQLQREAGLGLRTVRLAFVYGDGDPHLAQSLGFAARRPAHWRLHMVHHADVAQGLDLVLRASDVDGRVFNVADDAPVTGWELATRCGEPSPAVDGPVDPWEGIVDTRRIRDELGYRPVYPTVYAAEAAGAL